MTVIDEPQQAGPFGTPAPEPGVARQAINEMIDAGLLDDLMDRVDRDGLALTGPGGVLPELVKAVLERGLQAELTGHLGYEKGDPAGRNGATPVTAPRRRRSPPRSVMLRCACRGTGPAASSPGWCRRAPAGPAAWTR